MPPLRSYLVSIVSAALSLTVWSNWGERVSFNMPGFYLFQIALALLVVSLTTVGPFLAVRLADQRWPYATTIAAVPLGALLGLLGAVLMALFAGHGLAD